MAIQIQDTEVERTIFELASMLKVNPVEAVGYAVGRELNRFPECREMRLARMRSASDRIVMLPLVDDRSADEVLGYDDLGLPT